MASVSDSGSGSSSGSGGGGGLTWLVVDSILDLCKLGLAAMAAHVVATSVRKAVGAPLVMMYIVLGIAMGPHALAILDDDAYSHLWFVRDTCISVIGFVAATELLLRDLDKPRSLFRTAVKNIVASYLIVTPAIILLGLAGLPWLKELSIRSLLCVGLVLSVMGIVRAPSVTVAVLCEIKAKGPFSRTCVQLVVVLSVVVILLFAVNSAICEVIVKGSASWSDLANVSFELIGSLLVGACQAGVIAATFSVRQVMTRSKRLTKAWRFRIRVVLRASAIFAIALAPSFINYGLSFIPFASGAYDLRLDPLLGALVGGFVVTNWTIRRQQFAFTLGLLTPWLFPAFFVLTGVGLNIAVLKTTWELVPIVFVLRCLSLFLAHLIAVRSRYPWRYRAMLWLGHISQGGVSVSLVAQLPHKLPSLGEPLSAVVIGVLVVNTIVGPSLLKWVVGFFGETDKTTAVGRMVLVGTDARATMFAAKLLESGWQVHILDTSAARMEEAKQRTRDIFASPKTQPTWGVLTQMGGGSTASLASFGVTLADSLVIALPTDEENLIVAQAAVDMGLSKVLVKLVDPANAERFLELHVLLLDMTSPLLSFAGSSGNPAIPFSVADETARLLDHQPRHRSDLRTVRVIDPLESHYGKAFGQVQWPRSDVLVSAIIRGTHWVVPNQSTVVEPGDKFVVVGSKYSIDSVAGGEDAVVVSDRALPGSVDYDPEAQVRIPHSQGGSAVIN